ncbi:tyrosyl-tRNA synthetase [Aphelenchoides avenae]|nr:tyrosyl-tRNA synthetase [Aphelenchus avenae]
MADTVELDETGRRRKELIVRNLQEVLGEEKLTKQLATGKNIHIYWGTATTGKPHVTILFADVHAFLDNLKSTFEVLEQRVRYYEHIIKSLLIALNVPIDKLHFVKGSSYQLTEAYTQDVLRLCGQVSQRDALKAGAEVVKQVESPLLSGLLYPLLQALDEQHLKVDGQTGGVDQRKIFILAEEQLPKLKLGKRFHLMNPMVPGLTGTKMSSSEENTKIDLLDPSDVVSRKIETAFCPKGNTAENGVLAFYRFVVYPIIQPKPVLLDGKRFPTYDEIEDAFESDVVTESALKTYLKDFLNGILGKVREMSDNEEMAEIIAKGYPKNWDKAKDTEAVPNGTANGAVEPQPNLDDADKQFVERISKGSELLQNGWLLERVASKKPVRVLWRVSAKGRVHLGHLSALLELQRLQSLGCECSVLVSELAAFLDNEKCPWNAFEGRRTYYETLLKSFMHAIGLSSIPIRFSKEHHFKDDYTLEMYKSVSKVTRDETALVQGNTLATHLVPVYFALDAHYADADILLLSENQGPFIALADKILHSLGHPRRAALLHPVIPGMDGKPMSSTQNDFLLEPFDTAKQVRTKIGKSFCEPGNLEGNIALQLTKDLLWRLNSGKPIVIERTEENGGNLTAENYAQLEEQFKSQKLHPADLKSMMTNTINNFFEPVRKELADKQTKLLQASFPVNKGAKGGKKN